MMRQNDIDVPAQIAPQAPGIAVFLCRAGRSTLKWSTAAMVAALCASPDVAQASSHRHAAHSAHAGSRLTALKPTHSASRHHDRQARVHSLSRGAAREPSPVHKQGVSLANTTWDNPKIPPAVMNAIQAAAHDSGVDADLLAAVAWRESRFDPKARNRSSSAKGLLQFTNATWLQMIRDYGSEYNEAGYANAIRKSKAGALVVSGSHVRTAILKLRSDPVLSAKLAAENMRRERVALQDSVGRGVVPADLYLLHVLGPTGTIRFLNAVSQRPSEPSTKVIDWKVLRNAGLLARDDRAMTTSDTYAAVRAMLEVQHSHMEPTDLGTPLEAVKENVDP